MMCSLLVPTVKTSVWFAFVGVPLRTCPGFFIKTTDHFYRLTWGGWNLRQWWSRWRVWGCSAHLGSCGAPLCIWPGTEPDSSPLWKPSVECPSFPPPLGSEKELLGWSWVWESGLWRFATLASSPQHCHLKVNLGSCRDRSNSYWN